MDLKPGQPIAGAHRPHLHRLVRNARLSDLQAARW
jgi:hypothetical protein